MTVCRCQVLFIEMNVRGWVLVTAAKMRLECLGMEVHGAWLIKGSLVFTAGEQQDVSFVNLTVVGIRVVGTLTDGANIEEVACGECLVENMNDENENKVEILRGHLHCW